MACLGPGREGMEITSGRRDARGLTFSVVIPARVLQPGVSTRGKQNWRIALCGYGMTLALRIAFTCFVSHRWCTSAVCTGSGTPWPDSVEGRGSGWLPGLPSISRYASFQLAVARCSTCSRTCRNPVRATLHRHASRPGEVLWRSAPPRAATLASAARTGGFLGRPEPRQPARLALCLQRKADSADTVALLNIWIEAALGLGACCCSCCLAREARLERSVAVRSSWSSSCPRCVLSVPPRELPGW
jgi:hypothetical protein